MTDENVDKILSRAAKLLALQEHRGATEAEAAVAAEHLQRLLQDHNLTLSQVEARSDGGETTTKRVKDDIKIRAATVHSEKWRDVLLSGIARNNFCLARASERFDGETRVCRVVVVGREININVTRMTYDYLVEVFCRSAKEIGLKNASATRRDYVYFMDGAVSRVIERLDERRRAREAEDEARRAPAAANGSHRELMLSDVYGSEADLNNDALNGFPVGTTAALRREAAERSERQRVEHDRLVAEGVDDTVAWYRAYGYDETQAVNLARRAQPPPPRWAFYCDYRQSTRWVCLSRPLRQS